MARGIGKLSFTKDWSKMNPPDFSTYEDSEEQVRADIQLLYNEIKDYLNNTIQPNVNEISAADITVSGGGNLQTKLAALDAEIDNVVLGQIPDGSLTSAKLAPGTLLSNVTSSLTITAVDMAAHPCDISNVQFRFSTALGMMFYAGRAVFTRSTGSGFVARFDITGPYDFKQASVCAHDCNVSDSEKASMSALGTLGAQLDISISSVSTSENTVAVDISGWFFCEEASS